MKKLSLKEFKAILKNVKNDYNNIPMGISIETSERGIFIKYRGLKILDCCFKISDNTSENEKSINVNINDLLKGLNTIKKDLDIDIVDNKLILKEGRKEIKISRNDDNTIKPINYVIDKTSAYKDFDYKVLINAQSKDVTRHYLCGVYFTENMVCATDGHKLHIINTNQNQEFDVIIPTNIFKTFDILNISDFKLRSLKDKDNKYNITSGKIEIVFEAVDGNYPNIKPLVTNYNDDMVSVDLDKNQFIESLKAFKDAKLCDLNGVIVCCESDKLNISTYNINSSIELVETMDCNFTSDKIFKVAFNYDYMLEILKNVKNDTIKIYSKSSCGTTPMNIKDGDNHFLIMPMRIMKNS